MPSVKVACTTCDSTGLYRGMCERAGTAVVCLQCDDPACMKSCLVDALSRNEETGAIVLDQDKCVKCMACVAACPFGCSLYDAQHDLVVKCDLCDGDPVCAHFCPTKALEFKPIAPTRRKATG